MTMKTFLALSMLALSAAKLDVPTTDIESDFQSVIGKDDAGRDLGSSYGAYDYDYDYDYGYGYGHGYQCFPTMASPGSCDCTCCGYLPPRPEPKPEPCSYRSKGMMSGSGYDDDCGSYRSKGMMGGSRRIKETTEQGERVLPGKGWGGGWGGPMITCDCDCDKPSSPRSKGMMGGSKKSGSGNKKSGPDSYYY